MAKRALSRTVSPTEAPEAGILSSDEYYRREQKMDYIVRALRENPELAVFLTLAVGFLIGRVKIGSFSLGTVVGTLLAGVLIGQLNIKVPSTVKSIFFLLFLFTTGYKVGPQFFRGLKRDAVPQLALTIVLCTTCLVTGGPGIQIMLIHGPGEFVARPQQLRFLAALSAEGRSDLSLAAIPGRDRDQEPSLPRLPSDFPPITAVDRHAGHS